MQYTPAQLERRMRRVRFLLETHDEPYDVLSRTERDLSGFADPEVRTYVCGLCSGTGCPKCVKGRVRVTESDRYDTGVKSNVELNRPQTMSEAELDGALKRLREDQLMRDGVIADFELEPVFLAAEARDRRGDYRKLRMALDVLPRRLRGDAAVRWLAEHMPGPIRIPREAYELELESIGHSVRLMRAAGRTVSEIARELSVSGRQVRNALRAKTAA